MEIKIDKGLDIPIEGAPQGPVETLPVSKLVALNLHPFDDIAFRLLVKEGDAVKIGTPLVEDKKTPGRVLVSPASGVVKEVRRGEKRRLEDIVIETGRGEEFEEGQPLAVERATREQLLERLLRGGLFSYIRRRPFNLLANPAQTPRSIFVKALESAPFAPSAEMQVEGHEKAFSAGLQVLSKLTDGKVHLVYRKGSSSAAFTDAAGVTKHTAEGPHPVANSSVHIHLLDPIEKPEDIVWTLTALDVVRIGHYLLTGRVFNQSIVGIGGTGILPEKRRFYKVKDGVAVTSLVADKVPKGPYRLISGNVLTGSKVGIDDFLRFGDVNFCVIPEATMRELLHFFRLGVDKYSASGAYVSGHLDNSRRRYRFTTSLHGEPRFFVTNVLYDKVMPMRIPTMSLIKAIMAEDFEQAEMLGILEVIPEDVALPTFVCPSKVEMTEILRQGLRTYASQVLQ